MFDNYISYLTGIDSQLTSKWHFNPLKLLKRVLYNKYDKIKLLFFISGVQTMFMK